MRVLFLEEVEWFLSVLAVLGTGTFWLWIWVAKIVPAAGLVNASTVGDGLLCLGFVAICTIATLSAVAVAINLAIGGLSKHKECKK